MRTFFFFIYAAEGRKIKRIVTGNTGKNYVNFDEREINKTEDTKKERRVKYRENERA